MGVREGSRTGDLRVTEALINKRKVVGAGREEHVRQEGQTQSGKFLKCAGAGSCGKLKAIPA